VQEFLDRLYSSQACGYKAFSELVLNEDTVFDQEEIITQVAALPHARDVVKAMLDSPSLTSFDLVDWAGIESDKARSMVGLFVRKNALKRGHKAYVKTPGFIAMLKKLQMNGRLKNETEYEQTMKEEF
jgi:hypothetical protein